MTVIRRRRSIRKYRSTLLDEQQINLVLESARLAPSWGNRQCSEFIIVSDKSMKEEIGEICRQNWMAQAPTIIVCCADPLASGIKWDQEYYLVDVGISMEHLVLAATDLGLGTCWVGAFNEKALKKALNVPRHIRVVALTPLGYPDEEPKPKIRKSIDEISHKNCYMQKETRVVPPYLWHKIIKILSFVRSLLR